VVVGLNNLCMGDTGEGFESWTKVEEQDMMDKIVGLMEQDLLMNLICWVVELYHVGGKRRRNIHYIWYWKRNEQVCAFQLEIAATIGVSLASLVWFV